MSFYLQAARIAFNTMNVANLIGSGINIGCTGYNIIDKLINKERVSPLELFQFASSVLFFHQSVVGFKTANTIISETQSTTLQNYEKTLRSNRHRYVRLFVLLSRLCFHFIYFNLNSNIVYQTFSSECKRYCYI